MALGKQIRYYRTQLGLTLEQLSEASQVDVGTISALEVRDSKRSQYAPAIAAALGLSIEELLDESRDYFAEPRGSKATVWKAREPSPPPAAPWPFPDIAPSEYAMLPPSDRAQVQGFAMALVMKAKRRVA